jgi:CheY-like chemotaxis protein
MSQTRPFSLASLRVVVLHEGQYIHYISRVNIVALCEDRPVPVRISCSLSIIAHWMLKSHNRGPRILIIDDNVEVADCLAFALQALRYNVRAIYDGLDGVAAARQEVPDVVLIDLDMPRMDGFEVAKRIRQTLGATVFLIAHTAWGDVATRHRCKRAGFDHHLMKPATLVEILSVADPSGAAGLEPLMC